MSNQIFKSSTVMVLTALLLTFAASGAALNGTNNGTSLYSKIYGQQQTDGSVSVQVLKAKPDNPGNSDKNKDKDVKDKKPKQIQNVKISGVVDVSQVSNATDAAQSYSFVLTSGSYISKPKQLDQNISDTTESLKVTFNGKLPVTSGDTFTVTAESTNDAYNTVSSSGVFTDQPQGKSGKTTIVGNLKEPIVLQEAAVVGVS